MKYKLLTISILSGVFLASQQAQAAKYKVTEVTPLSDYKQHFAIDISNTGDVIGITREKLNYPFYLEDYLTSLRVNSNTVSCDVSDEEKTTGNFDAFSARCVKLALEGFSENARYQKIGDSKSFINNSGVAELVNLTDVNDDELGALTHSNLEFLRSINASGISVGSTSAPFLPIMFQQTGDNVTSTDPIKLWQRAYGNRAVIYANGEVKLIEPEYTLYGGKSEATDISDTGYVSGLTSVSMAQSTIDSIKADCTGELQPENVCVWGKSLAGEIYHSRPVVWQIDQAGNILSSTIYDLAFTPTDSQTANYFATATAVNDAGVAVGHGHVPRDNGRLPTQPLLYRDGKTTSFTDIEKYDRGFSADINNNGVVVGTVQKIVDGRYHNEYFIYDSKTETFETPQTFYAEAESIANAINDSGKVVGEAEYEVTTDIERRKHGFLYDSVTKEFFDLNALTECNSQFEIVETRGINNSDQIVATALKLVDKRDALGEVETDDNGVVEKEQVAVTVILDPIAGEIDDCATEETPPIERKGGSMPLLASIGLFLVGAIRRRFF